MKSKRESGEVVVEASIIVTLAVMVITVMLYIGMIIYQKTLVSVIANQTASNIAQVYSNNMKDPFTGYVEPDRVYQSVTYGNMKTDAYLSFVRDKASVLGDYRMESSAILKNDYTTVDVEIVKKPNELLKSQIVITIQDRFNLPLAFLLGGSSAFNFTATGRADCVDILEYVNGVEAVGDPSDSNIIYLPDAKNCTVTFIPDSDNPGDLKTQTVLKGHSIMSSNKYTHCVMPAEPKKGELEFAGWYTDDGRAFTSVTQVDNNTTVYGRWMCTVTMNANGGTVNGKTTDTKKVAYGNRTALPTPVRDGYIFQGWFDGGNVQYCANDTPIVKNVTLTARWERRVHKVTFNPNGGTLPAGVSSQITVNHKQTVGMPTPKNVGKTFGGWYDDDGKKYDNNTIIISSVELTAKWNNCSHVMGCCGVEHSVNLLIDEHARGTPQCYFGTTEASCIVCAKCGCWLDGKGRAVDPVIKKQYGSAEPISPYIWCLKHKEKAMWTGYRMMILNDNKISDLPVYCVH